MMPKATQITAAAVILACVSGASAVNIETVPVGNPRNAGEWSGGTYTPARICGAVDYTYNIGKYEVTAGQYTEFLNAVAKSDPYGLYNSNMDMGSTAQGCQITQHGSDGNYTYDFSGGTVEAPGSTAADWENRPVNFVSWGDAARFANWMHNGQPTGDTENGSYSLNGAMSDAELLAVSREADATWVLASEDEWYKAAYYSGSGSTYYDSPTGTDSTPSHHLDGGGNNATCYGFGYTIGVPYYRTEVGAHVNSDSPYGTFDQGGNVHEWNETVIGSSRGIRGGSFISFGHDLLASFRTHGNPTFEHYQIGFRLAYVPEPSSLGLLALGGLTLLRRRR